ncbi:MAG: DUF192 domain-containing protein [Idiomarina sp.]|nr:DUF192 domain-containing protein [Idiomarina sp.]
MKYHWLCIEGEVPIQLQLAHTFWRRLWGWRLRKPDTALWLMPCRHIHTFGLSEPIHLVWLNSACQVVRIDFDVRPWQRRFCCRAASVVEVSAANELNWRGAVFLMDGDSTNENWVADTHSSAVP